MSVKRKKTTKYIIGNNASEEKTEDWEIFHQPIKYRSIFRNRNIFTFRKRDVFVVNQHFDHDCVYLQLFLGPP